MSGLAMAVGWAGSGSRGNTVRLWMLSGGKVRRARSWAEMMCGWRDGQERAKCPIPRQRMQRTGSRHLAMLWSEARQRKHLPAKHLLKASRAALGTPLAAALGAAVSGAVRFRRPVFAFCHSGEPEAMEEGPSEERALKSTRCQIVFRGRLRASGDAGTWVGWTSTDLSLAGAAPPVRVGSSGFGWGCGGIEQCFEKRCALGVR